MTDTPQVSEARIEQDQDALRVQEARLRRRGYYVAGPDDEKVGIILVVLILAVIVTALFVWQGCRHVRKVERVDWLEQVKQLDREAYPKGR